MSNSIKFFLANSISVRKISNFNKYHDKFGKFTWSPFGKYKGNAYGAESIYGKEYNDMIKNYDVSQLTDKEMEMIENYIASPSFGNSYDKNAYYDEYYAIVDDEGRPASPEKAKEYEEIKAKIDTLERELRKVNAEKYNTPEGPKRDELEKKSKEIDQQIDQLNRQRQETGYHDGKLAIPNPMMKLPKLEILSNPDVSLTQEELKSLEMRTLGKGNYDKFKSMERGEQYRFCEGYGDELVNGKKFKDFTPEQQRAFKMMERAEYNSDKKELFNDIKYGDDKYYVQTEYPGTATVTRDNYSKVTSVAAKNSSTPHVSFSYLQTLPTNLLKAYEARLGKYDSGIKMRVEKELKSREMDKLIETKGVSFSKDIVVTRRVKDMKQIERETRDQGFYTQQGFTSTTAANNIAKKSPGTMVFGDNVLKIVIPAGTKVLPMEAVMKARNKSTAGSYSPAMIRQHELLLPQKTKYISTDQTNPKQLTNITDSSSQAKFSPTLGLDKIDTSWDYDKGYNNSIYSMIAITEEYQKGR